MEIFASSVLTLLLAFVSWLISWHKRETRKTREARMATFEDCDARDAWFDWWMKNCRSPNAWKSKKVQQMMKRVVLAKIKWKQTHPHIEDGDPFEGFVLMPKA